MVRQLRALTDFPTRFFIELHPLDQASRLHECRLHLGALEEAVRTVLCSGQTTG